MSSPFHHPLWADELERIAAAPIDASPLEDLERERDRADRERVAEGLTRLISRLRHCVCCGERTSDTASLGDGPPYGACLRHPDDVVIRDIRAREAERA